MLKYIDIKEIPETNKANQIIKDLEDFIASPELAAEVIAPAGRSVGSVYTSYKNAIINKSYKINCRVRSGRLFLIKEKI